MKQAYDDSKRRYGAVKICRTLNDNGTPCGVKRVQRHMAEQGLRFSDDKGVNAVVLVKGVKGFLILLYLIGVEAVDLCRKRCQLFGGGQVVGDMYAVKTSGFQPDDDSPELMVL